MSSKYILSLTGLIALSTSLPLALSAEVIATDSDIPVQMGYQGTATDTGEYIAGATDAVNLDWSTAARIRVGGRFITLTVQNGSTVTASNTYISESASAYNNTLHVKDAGSLYDTGDKDINIGRFASNNTLRITNGGKVANRNAIFSYGSAAENNLAEIDGAGSQWVVSNSLTIGRQGSANTLRVTNGGSVRSGSVEFGQAVSSANNRAFLSGNGSRWDIATSLAIGVAGSENSIQVGNGALLAVEGDLTFGAGDDNLLQVANGYVAWLGDHVADLEAFIGSGLIQIQDDSGWSTGTLDDFIIEYIETDADGLAFTNGAYGDLGGYTILTAVPEPSTYAALAGALTLGVAMIVRRRRN